ncbi:MAG: amidohydrolase [Rhodoblastus sp.]
MLTTIYRARKIITMNPARPVASHVAVREGRILGAGTLEELTGWGKHRIDDCFADLVLMPGLIEGHSHAFEGAVWRYIYCGWFDRIAPDGKTWTGLRSLDGVIARLAEQEKMLAQADAPLTGWGLDPIYFDNKRMTREDLDSVSKDRPIGVMHASFHILNVNTRALKAAGLLRTGINHPGVPLGRDGLPTGEMKGPDAQAMVAAQVGLDRAMMSGDERGLRDFARLCVRKGVTTATDLANPLPPDAVAMMLRVTGNDSYPARIVPLRRYHSDDARAAVEAAAALGGQSTDRLRFGCLKIVVDGSIQGFSARLRWPVYYNGAPNGLWYVPPERLAQALEAALQTGVLVHCHTNGDEATELVLDTMEAALRKHPSPDHRFTLQHCQLADRAQLRRAARLGMCVNLFPNHHYYWGDEHYRLTVGPERATRMNACRTALDCGVPLAIHSDAPVTPLGPLFTAWCAVNRLTASGRTLGEAEKITVDEALRAITLGAAWTLKLDGELGSIETGKHADFAILEDDPETISGDRLKDVRIWGTVQGGRIFEAAGI